MKVRIAHSAPDKYHRKGLSIVELTRMFPNDDVAREWIESIRWPEGARCPKCDSDNIQSNVKHKTMTHRCRTCRKWFSVRTGTAMQSSKVGLQVWVIAVYLLNTGLKGQSSMKLHRDLNVTQKTAWHLAHRIREAWEDNGGSLFGSPVEADETYIGGKRKNMSNAKRHGLKKADAEPGTAGKAVAVGTKDRATNKARARHVSATDVPHVARFIAAHTDGMESFWSMLKRGYQRAYHHVTEKHLQRYVKEFAGRHNIRHSDTIKQMAATITGMVGKRLRYSDHCRYGRHNIVRHCALRGTAL